MEADHLTCIYIPHLGEPVGAELVRFHQLTRTLREQCPWDREQDHQTLVRYLLEETYELVDALRALDPDDPATDEHVIEELGDLLYQIEFHATIAEQDGRFTMADVARGVHDKLVRRHPHVFGDVDAQDTATVLRNWDAIKREEKQRTSVFDGVALSQPALMYADAVQRKAAKLGFDWPDVHGALPKIAEEAAELVAATDHHEQRRRARRPALRRGQRRPPPEDRAGGRRCAAQPTSSAPASRPSKRWPAPGASTCTHPISPRSTHCGTR